MSDTYRAMCAELVRRWDAANADLVARARALLAQPVAVSERRPKPPSLKEQALVELGDVYNRDKIDDVTYDTIRRAIEQLPN